MDPLIVLFGIGVGIMVGTTGVGGGSLMTPALILVFNTKPTVAIGTDLAYAAVTKTVGGWRHLRNGTVDLATSGWLAVGSVPGALGGVYVLHLLERSFGKQSFDDLVLTIVAAALLVTGIAVLARVFFLKGSEDVQSVTFGRREKIWAIALGLTVGFVLGLTSAGSGSLIAVGLILLFRLAPKEVVATDVFHAAILLWAAAIAHVVAGNVDYGLAGTILLGSIPGVWIGSHWSIRTPVATLRTGLGVIMIGASLGLLSKAGAEIPGWVLAAVPLLLLVLVARPQIMRWLRPVPPAPAPER
jgi:uncharacterized protein